MPARYEERQWVPWWVAPAIFVGCAAFVAAVYGIAAAIRGPGVLTNYTSEALLLAVCAALAATPLLARARIRVGGGTLTVGRRSIPLDEVTELRIVDGDELKAIRRAMLAGIDAAVAGTGASVLGPAGQLAGQLSLTLALMRNRRTLEGMNSLVWQRPALLLETPGCRTKRWIVGTRRPEELLAATRAAIGDAQPGYGDARVSAPLPGL